MRVRSLLTKLWILTSLPLAFSQDSVSYASDSYGEDDELGTPYQTFMSNTMVKPPQMQINSNASGLQEGYVFLDMNGEPTSGQEWPVIFDFSEDRMGTLVWSGNYTKPFDFSVQTYKGSQVLTFWSGEVADGFGRGSFYILNQSYVEVAHFQVDRFGDDMGDLHEFEITADDTALVAIYHPIPWNLSASGGSEDGWLLDGTFQEIDMESGELVFEWNSSSHVGINETYDVLSDEDGTTEENAWDYFHMNSVQKDGNGDYLVSARIMNCIYKISGEDGHVIWRLQGKQSNFEIDPAAEFAYQHDARWLNENQTRMTLFSNGPTENISYSRGLLLDINQHSMTARLIQDFINEAETFGQYKGSMQAIDPSNETTNYLVGFGSQPNFAELDHEGNILLDVQWGSTNAINGYRAYKQQWEGMPFTKPDIYWDRDTSEAYLSWNGATNVESWALFSANSSNATTWTNVMSARRTGFETTVDMSEFQLGDFVRGKAVNADGEAIDWTRASDGNDLFDAPDDVEERGQVARRLMDPGDEDPSQTEEAASEESEGAAATMMVEQIYVAAVVVFGGLALV